MRELQTFIYGSCVTRDGVDIAWESRGLHLSGYVARQSLISATSPADASKFRLDSVSSPFQKRMIAGDLSGNLFDQLRARQGAVDLLLWDLTDERLGIQTVPGGGGHVTRVVNYSKGIWQGHEPLGTPVTLGAPKHWDLWRVAADQMAAFLEKNGLLKRTAVNATPWATETDAGERVSYEPMPPEKFNETMLSHYEYLGELGFKVVRPDQATVIARTDHKWGLAPFHYINEVYSNLLDHVLQEINLPENN